jgi:hypothetical protein
MSIYFNTVLESVEIISRKGQLSVDSLIGDKCGLVPQVGSTG